MTQAPLGTSLPVPTDASLFPVVVVGMGGVPKARDGKFTPDGRQTFGSGAVLLVQRKDGSVQADKTASVHVVSPADTYGLGEQFMAEGKVWVQPYESNSRVALSITVEKLVPVLAPAAAGKRASGGEG